jgi:hypothetical protein
MDGLARQVWIRESFDLAREIEAYRNDPIYEEAGIAPHTGPMVGKLGFENWLRCQLRELGRDPDKAKTLAEAFAWFRTSLRSQLHLSAVEQRAAAIQLQGQGECPIVKGKTKPQYNVVQTLLEAGTAGLTKDELVAKSGHGDARGILKRLIKDKDWASAISLARKTGGRYRTNPHLSTPLSARRNPDVVLESPT